MIYYKSYLFKKIITFFMNLQVQHTDTLTNKKLCNVGGFCTTLLAIVHEFQQNLQVF